MADNYLERRMEDMRNGRLATSNLKRNSMSAASKGVAHRLSVVDPELRVFITGGASGIGEAIVKAFREIDMKVAFCDIDSRKGNSLAQSCGARFYPLDVKVKEDLERALQDITSRWKGLDVIVNNVGVGNFCSLSDTSDNNWQEILDTNLTPLFITSRFISRLRKESGEKGGTIINLSSTRHIQSETGTFGYSATKGAIASATHSLMMELAPYGITVNSISPGWINTHSETPSEEDHLQHPSGRVGLPEDIARIVLFLSHPDNNFINGADIVADGGMTRKMIYIED